MINHINISGHITLNGSKSILNRVLIIASYLQNKIAISHPSNCLDVTTMADNLCKLGLKIDKANKNWIITPPKKPCRNCDLFIQDSGTAYRFLISRAAALNRTKISIQVSEQLKKRPIRPLIEVLREMGAKIEFSDDILLIKGTILEGGVFDIPANVSSQFISSLLLIAPSYKNDLELFLEGDVVSSSYIDMTIKIMQDFGVIAEYNGKRIFIEAGQEYNELGEYDIEPDFSSAAYFWALGALSRSVISTNNVNHNSIQADHGFIEIIKNMGAEVKIEKNKISVTKNRLRGISVSMRNMPDQVPTLAVLALFADSQVVIKDIEHLKYKESNRIKALITELTRLGAKISYEDGILTINSLDSIPGSLILKTFGDHRLVMAFHILKMVFPQIMISDVLSVAKSYPNFLEDIKSIK